MKMRECSRLSACTLLLALALLSGCGSSEDETIPSTTTIFYAHTAVFGSNSTAFTAGYNAFGQLGDGTIATPRAVAAQVPIGRVGGIAAGGVHTLAFGNNSSVYAWGSNYQGQLGDAAIPVTGSSAYSANPIRLQMPNSVTDVAAGGYHSLALTGGNVQAWGYNGYGQLGNGNANNSGVPVAVLGLAAGQITKVAAGGTHSLALSRDQRVYAWGRNAYGQVGGDGFEATLTPFRVMQNISTAKIAKIAAGGSSSYALETRTDPGTGAVSQRLWGWGYNGMGQLGLSPLSAAYFSAPNPMALPSAVAAGAGILKMAAGVDHLLILVDDGTGQGTGTVWGIGFNSYAQLGNDSTTNSASFVPVYSSGTTQLTGVTDIAASGHHSLAKVNGVWFGWGDNGSGQLGNPVSKTGLGYLRVPTLVQGF